MATATVVVPSSKLIAHMPPADAQRLVSRCEAVDLEFGATLATRGQALTHVYFPTDSFISLIATIDGDSVEVGLAGDEGMMGVSLALGVEATNLRAVVQGGGPALRMSTEAFLRELARNPGLRETVGRYTSVVMNQLAQSAVCNRFHVVEQRLARWLLMTADRAHGESFAMTQEFLAAMLGVRRVGVTNAAGELQSRELIRYSRGQLRILDRKGLEKAACSCYKADIASYATAWS